MAISMLKIRRPLGRLIFNMGIAIPGKTVFLIETAPRHLMKCLWHVCFQIKKLRFHRSLKFFVVSAAWLHAYLTDSLHIYQNNTTHKMTMCLTSFSDQRSRLHGSFLIFYHVCSMAPCPAIRSLDLLVLKATMICNHKLNFCLLKLLVPFSIRKTDGPPSIQNHFLVPVRNQNQTQNVTLLGLSQ